MSTLTARRLAKKLLGPAQIEETGVIHDALRGRRGVMLDVGAHYGSSLAPFAASGWQVYAFEPDPGNRSHLTADFGATPNVTILPVGVADQPGTLPLYTSAESTGISSLTPFTAGHAPTATVEVVTLADVIAEHQIRHVDFMKVDVEGLEGKVMAGYDWSVAPDVIELEFEDSKSASLGYTWRDLADELVTRGYQVLVSEWSPITRYGGDGAQHSWRRFARYPTELLDALAWGNLIAARDLDAIGITAATARAQRRLKVRSKVDALRTKVA